MGGIDFQSILLVAAGGAGAGFLNKIIPSNISPQVSAIGKIAVGTFLPMIAKEGKAKMAMNNIGSGFIAVGTYELLKNLGVISGVGADVKDSDVLAVAIEGIDDVDFETMGENVLGEDVLGAEDIPVVNGEEDIPVVNGDNEYEDLGY